jgi:protein-S-isoprenylcysteine O-methyltransferase Ste14
VTGVGVLLLGSFAVIGAWTNLDIAHETIENVGRVLIAICVLGRCWCTLYIGGRKGETLVAVGPYSICRNPLYFFSFVGAAGVGAQTGSVLVALICTVLIWIVFRVTVAKEEAFLIERHGEAYSAYLSSTPRFLPNPALWKPVASVEVYPKRVVATFMDGMLFVLAIPLIEVLEKLQHFGWIPVLITLP